MPGKMAYANYTSNDGNVYALKTRLAFLGIAGLGLNAWTPGTPPMPRGMEPRQVYVQDPSGGATRSVPVGQVTADAWTGLAATLPLDYSGIAGTTNFNIIGKSEERPAKVPHTITNRSDAP